MEQLTDTEFLEALERLDIRVSSSQGKLQINAPAGRLDEALRAELSRRKDRLLTILSAPADGKAERDWAPLTFAQQQIWLIDLFHPGTSAYNIPQAFLVEHTVDMHILQQAVAMLAKRHRILAAYVEETDHGTGQSLSRSVAIPIEFIDLSHLDEPEQSKQVKDAILTFAQMPFHLHQAPLIRFRLLRLKDAKYVVALNIHHIIADLWSLNILHKELWHFYEAILSGQSDSLPSLRLQYLDYAAHESERFRSSAFQQQLGYWHKQLHGMPTLLALPFHPTQPATQSFAGAIKLFSVPDDLANELQILSQREGVSLFMTLLASFAALFYRYTGQCDFCIGSPVSVRDKIETEGLIGLFINTLVLRFKVDGEMTFHALLGATRETTLDAFANKDVPFQKLVNDLNPERDPGRSPFFQVMFSLDVAAGATSPRTKQLNAHPGTSKVDLSLHLENENGKIAGTFEYRTDLFDEEKIEKIIEHYLNVLRSIKPDAKIKELTLQDSTERNLVLVEWNKTQLAYPTNQTIVDLFNKQVEETPQSDAVIFFNSKISYQELNERANQLAHVLVGKGAGPETLIGIFLERSTEMIVAMLAILKAGAAYLPLDPAYPASRIQLVLEDSHAKICITQSHLVSKISDAGLEFILTIDAESAHIASQPIYNSSVDIQPEHAAYVIYTSGSTGKPKGVVVEHRNTVSFLYWARSVFTSPHQKVFAATSICFDLSIFEIFFSLCFGHTIVLAEDVLQLKSLPAAGQVTLLNSVPSAIASLVRSAALPESVHTVNSAGEFLPDSLVRDIYAAGSVAHVYDLYGPTETTTYSTFALRDLSDSATIGRPIANTRIYLLDRDLQPVPLGIAGEIFIAGSGVTRGYLGRPDLTCEKFISLQHLGETGRSYRTGDLAKYRSDGNLEYIGRADHQVKLRGYRIEFGEIEFSMRSYDGVRSAIASVEGSRLVGYVEVDRLELFNSSGLLNALRENLPAYMVVSQLVTLRHFPLTANGKIDRNALRALGALSMPSASVRQPANLVERQLRNIWEHCFERKPIGVDENFFDIGGNSLLAFRIFSMIEQNMDKALMLSVLFQAPTIASLAGIIQDDNWQPPALSIKPLKISGDKTPIYFTSGVAALAEHLDSPRPAFMIESASAKDLQLFQPEADYVLCGTGTDSDSLKRAAQELEADGARVTLILIEPITTNSEKSESLSRFLPGRRSRKRSLSSTPSGRTRTLIIQSEFAGISEKAHENTRQALRKIAVPAGELLEKSNLAMTASVIEDYLKHNGH